MELNYLCKKNWENCLKIGTFRVFFSLVVFNGNGAPNYKHLHILFGFSMKKDYRIESKRIEIRV